MRKFKTTIAAAGLLSLFGAGTANADGVTLLQPTCTNILTAPGGNGIFLMSQLAVTGTCVNAAGKLFGDFVFGSTFTDPASNVVFTLNTINGQDHHGVSFNTTYLIGNTYSLSYQVEVFPLPSSLFITELDGDFTQSGNVGTSHLVKNSDPTGSPATGIDMTKIGATLQAGSVTDVTYPAGTVQDLAVSDTLTDGGAVSSIIDTVIESGHLIQVPEPGSLALIGLALSALGVAGRRRKSH